MLDKNIAQQVVNNLYAVFLGFVLSSFFTVEKTGDSTYAIQFFSGIEWIVLLLLVTYYMVDWFTTLFLLKNDDEITYYHMFLLLSANIALCYTILLSINGGYKQFLVFGLYSLIVPLWDFVVSADKLKTLTYKNHQKVAVKYKYRFVLGTRFIFGIALCIPLAFLAWKGATSDDEQLRLYVYSVVTAIVLIKCYRMQVILKIYA